MFYCYQSVKDREKKPRIVFNRSDFVSIHFGAQYPVEIPQHYEMEVAGVVRPSITVFV